MPPSLIRRLLTVSAILMSTLAGAVPAGAAHAGAAPKARVDLLVHDLTLAPSGESAGLTTFAFADRRVSTRGMTLHFRVVREGSGLHLLTTGHFGNCGLRGAEPDDELSCRPGVESIGPDGSLPRVDGFISADSTAVPGSVSDMTVTMTVPGHAPVVRTARVRIGEPVQLTRRYEQPAIAAAPGASFDATLPIRNDGPDTIRGVAVYPRTPWSFQSRIRYRNCWYIDDRLTACVFDQELAPGTDYRLDLPYLLRRDTYAPSHANGQFTWMTRADFDDLHSFIRRGGYAPLGSPGDGAVLRVRQTSTAKAVGLPQADVRGNGPMNVTVRAVGVQGAGLAAVGDRASGRAGTAVTVSVGVNNKGPATIDTSNGSMLVEDVPVMPATIVTMPPGTTAVAVPRFCIPLDTTGRPQPEKQGVPGFPGYECPVYRLAKVGTRATVDIGLRIDRVIANARGTVRVGRFAADLTTTDNIAPIVINPPAASAPSPGVGDGGDGNGGNGEGGTSGNGEGGTSGGGGGLAITGPSGTATGGAGVLLIAAGALCLLVTRRRHPGEG